MNRSALVATLSLLMSLVPRARGVETTTAGNDFFEKHIRPVLAERCYQCHSATAQKVKGELLLDSRAGVMKGGKNGPS